MSGIFSAVWLIWVIFESLASSNGELLKWSRYRQALGWRITGNDGYRVDVDIDKLSCVFQCMESTECLVISYNALARTCTYINQTYIVAERETENVYTIIYVRQLSVAHLSGIPRYVYDYDQARAACTTHGSRLMTTTEMTNLFISGLEMCSCGWVEGGHQQYPMQHLSYICGGYIGVVTCVMNPKANAWCTFE